MKKNRIFMAVIFIIIFANSLHAAPQVNAIDKVKSIRVMVEAEPEPEYGYVYTPEDIKIENPLSITEIFEDMPGADVITKGLPGLMSEVKFNAGTFEQTGVLLEGVKIHDPQTGHFNFDIPITLFEAGRIDVVNNASSIAGSGGFAGLINIETPDAADIKSTIVTGYGTFNSYYYGGTLVKNLSKGSGLIISAERSNSDGYLIQDNKKRTDYNRYAVFGKYTKSNGFEIMTGYSEKEFGAYDFYTPGRGLPSREKTKAFFSLLDWIAAKGLNIRGHIRTHHDTFTLTADDPSYYRNIHDTFAWSTEAKYKYVINPGNRIIFKYSYGVDSIESSNLGGHNLHKNAGLINGYFNFAKIVSLNLNLGAEKYIQREGFDLMPSGTISVEPVKDVSVYGGYSHAIRYPNFTELYYSDPYNSGDDSLAPEKTNVFDGGIKVKIDKAKVHLSGFYRMNYNLIDWGKDDISEPVWQIQNIGEVNVMGASAGIELPIDNMKVKVNYTYLDAYKSKEYISKYGLAYLRNKLSVVSDLKMMGIQLRFKYIYKKYIDRKEPINQFDLAATAPVSKWSRATVKIENILNTYYEEIAGIPSAGRYIEGAVEVGF